MAADFEAAPMATPIRRAEQPTNVLELLYPGSFVKLRNQPPDLPPFQLIQCRGGRCWVRQQAWGQQVHWEVSHRQLTAAA
jgi:hypothetical protein